MKILAIQKTTLIDYPGHVAATVFLAGCNFRCPWCYSKELVLPELIKTVPEIPEQKILEFLRGKKSYLEGIVLCGGEPTVNPDLPQFIQKIKDMGFLVKLDTNGSNPEMLDALIGKKLIDYVAMDIKLPKERYDQVFFAAVPVENIQKSIDILKTAGVDYEFRTTVVPGVHTEDDLILMSEWVGGSASSEQAGEQGKPKYYLQNFRAERNIDPAYGAIKPYSDEFFAQVCAKIAGRFSVCKLR